MQCNASVLTMATQVRQWVEEYAKARGVKKFVAGQVNHASRTVGRG